MLLLSFLNGCVMVSLVSSDTSLVLFDKRIGLFLHTRRLTLTLTRLTLSHREVEPFHEWYQNYTSLRHLLSNESLSPALTAIKPSSHAPYMAPPAMAAVAAVSQQAPSDFPNRNSCRTLILGCGNSRFGEDMLRDGWTGGIVNVDFSPVVIGQMKAKYDDAFYQHLGLNKSCMEFVCADITKGLDCFQDGSFDLIICKATFDAVLSSAGSIANGKQVIRDCNRLLADNHGVFMLVTFGNPDSRVEFLEHQGDLSYYWQGVSVHTVTRSSKELPAKYVFYSVWSLQQTL
jgi:SAM-dependent methyltransferase